MTYDRSTAVCLFPEAAVSLNLDLDLDFINTQTAVKCHPWCGLVYRSATLVQSLDTAYLSLWNNLRQEAAAPGLQPPPSSFKAPPSVGLYIALTGALDHNQEAVSCRRQRGTQWWMLAGCCVGMDTRTAHVWSLRFKIERGRFCYLWAEPG